MQQHECVCLFCLYHFNSAVRGLNVGKNRVCTGGFVASQGHGVRVGPGVYKDLFLPNAAHSLFVQKKPANRTQCPTLTTYS